MSRFNTVQHGSSRISKVVNGAATVVTRFIPDHQTGVNRHLKPELWERGFKTHIVSPQIQVKYEGNSKINQNWYISFN